MRRRRARPSSLCRIRVFLCLSCAPGHIHQRVSSKNSHCAARARADGENGVASPAIEIFNSATGALRTLYDVRARGARVVPHLLVLLVWVRGCNSCAVLPAASKNQDTRHTKNAKHCGSTPSQVPYLVELGGLNLYPVVVQLPWVAPGLPEGSYVIAVFSGVSGQVRRAAARHRRSPVLTRLPIQCCCQDERPCVSCIVWICMRHIRTTATPQPSKQAHTKNNAHARS